MLLLLQVNLLNTHRNWFIFIHSIRNYNNLIIFIACEVQIKRKCSFIDKKKRISSVCCVLHRLCNSIWIYWNPFPLSHKRSHINASQCVTVFWRNNLYIYVASDRWLRVFFFFCVVLIVYFHYSCITYLHKPHVSLQSCFLSKSVTRFILFPNCVLCLS